MRNSRRVSPNSFCASLNTEMMMAGCCTDCGAVLMWYSVYWVNSLVFNLGVYSISSLSGLKSDDQFSGAHQTALMPPHTVSVSCPHTLLECVFYSVSCCFSQVLAHSPQMMRVYCSSRDVLLFGSSSVSTHSEAKH